MNSRKTAAIIVAAGEGARLPGDRPKAYRLLNGKPLFRHSYDRLKAHPAIAEVVLVVNPAHVRWIEQGDLPTEQGEARSGGGSEAVGARPPQITKGGATRQESVANGLEALEGKGITQVLIHDAARPFLDAALIDRVLEGLQKHQAVIPAVPVKDTIKQREASRVTTPDRSSLLAVQTPQGFDYETILQLHKRYAAGELPTVQGEARKEPTDDALLAEWAGIPIHFVAGDERNRKITTQEDMPMELRTGMGFDVHRFMAGDHVMLCGVKLPCDAGLEGHSDADVGLHALTDAILGALALGDIGQHFPSDDPRWKGKNSAHFLRHACELMAARGASLVHADITVIGNKPKVGPHRDALRARVAEIAGIALDRVSVKATTTDGLGFTGRGEGLAAQAVATVRL